LSKGEEWKVEAEMECPWDASMVLIIHRPGPRGKKSTDE
jgi:hypothetical protein